MKKHFLFLSALALFLSSCEIFSSLSEKTGAISIKMPEGSERIAETYDVNEITSFTAELYDSGSSPVAKVSSAPGKSITFESLTPGSYAIVIKAFISAECAAYAEKSGIVVEAGATTYETVTLFKNIIKNIESVEIAKESLDKITKNYTVRQTFALPDNVSITAHFIHGYEKELEPNDYEIYICNAEKYTEETLVENQPLSENSRFAVIGICTESGYKYSAPVSLVMNAEEPVVTWTIPTVKDNTISFTITATASGEISYTWYKANTADMAEKTDCTSKINMADDGTVALPLKDESGAYVYYVCTVTNTNSAVNGTTTASRQTDVFGGQLKSFTAKYTGEYELSGQLDDVTAFEITETYADDSVLTIRSLSVSYKVSYAENLSNPEQLVGNIPLVITNLAAVDEDGKNLTCEVTVPFMYSLNDYLDFEITADGELAESTVTIAQYTGTIELSANNSLPEYMLYNGETNTSILHTESYEWYDKNPAEGEVSLAESPAYKVENLADDTTYYCVQTITSSASEWCVASEDRQKSIQIKTEPWIIEIAKSGTKVDGTSLDAGTYTLSCTNRCENGDEKITYSVSVETGVTLEGNILTVEQQSEATPVKIAAVINGTTVAEEQYTIPKSGTYNVTFDLNYDGSTSTEKSVTSGSVVSEPEVPTREGYTFAGWYTDAGCTNSYDFLTAVTESITLYAKWTVNTYTVTFNTNGGSAVDSQTVNYNSTATTPTAPTKEGYVFAGWYTDTECTVEYNFSGVVTENITLYAKWIEVITDWTTLHAKLNTVEEDVGDIYISGEFDVTSKIIFSGTANIISTGTGVTFSRKEGCESDFFSLYSGSLTFKGSESAPIVFDGTSKTQTSNLITNGGTTTFEYCSFKNNSSSNYASVYLLDGYNTSKTTFKSCTFTGNTGYKGGAVYVGEKDTVSFENCTFETNTASDCGGAVYIKAEATGTFSNCTFKSNTASYYGGAVYIESTGTGSFSDCTFEGNSANTRGGAIDSSGTADITNCTFTSNSATSDTGYGGAINIDSGTMTISSITCSGNTATTGKDIYHSNGTLNIGGTVSSIDIYMNNSRDAYLPVLVPAQGITLASGTDTINVEMYSCSEGTTVLTKAAPMSDTDFASAIKCFTLTNDGFVIGSNGKAETGTPISSFSELTNCLSSYSDSKATANIVISKDIEITGTVTICCNVNINADATGRTLSRGANFTDALFQIGTDVTGVTVNVGGSGGTLTIDGKGDTVKASFSLINAGSGGNTVKISKNAILQNNVTSRTHGAAIYAKDSTVIIEGGTVKNNDCSEKSDSYGGAIYATNFEMSSGSISGNNSIDAGGVYVLGSANITGGTISNNTASNYGGGIYLVGGTSLVSGVTFEGNTGTTRGGAIYVAGSLTVDITDCTFTSNVSRNGEAIAFAATGGTTSIGGTITITDNDNILLYYSYSVLNISKSLVSTYSIPLTISTVTSGNQYITASDGITLSDEISKFSLQNEGYTLTDAGVVQ